MDEENKEQFLAKPKACLISVGLMALMLASLAFRGGVGERPLSMGEWGVSLGLIGVLGTLIAYDLTRYRLPQVLTLPLILCGLVFTYQTASSDFYVHLAATLAGYGLILALHLYWRVFRGQDGIGMGDARLVAAAGAWFGPLWLPIFLTFGSSLGIASVILVRGLTVQSTSADKFAIPFGPALCSAFWGIWVLFLFDVSPFV